MRTKTVGLLVLVWGASAAGAVAQDNQAHSRTLRDPELHLLYYHDVSQPLRDMPVVPPVAEEGEERLHPVKLIRPPRAVPPGWVDPLAQAAGASLAPAPLVSTTPGQSFDGVGVGFPGFVVTGAPPDTNGAVGATQYVQWVNTSFAVFDKATGARVFGPAAGNSLWQGFGGPCETTNSGDPVALYDKAANRWVMTQFSINQSASQFFQCVAVSTTSDATGTYHRFAYQFTGFNDYPKVGVWPDGYYLTFNMFNAAGTAFLGARVCALDRTQMISASGTPRSDPVLPAHEHATAACCPPTSTARRRRRPARRTSWWPSTTRANDGCNLWKFHVDWTNSTNSTLTGPTKITTAAFSPACGGGTCIPQPGTTQQLDSLADRLMFRLAYRNFGAHESLVVNHSVTVGTTAPACAGTRSAIPGGTPTIFQPARSRPTPARAGWARSPRTSRATCCSATAPPARACGRASSTPAASWATRSAHDAGRERPDGRQRLADGEPQPLGRLQRDDDRPRRRLHVLVHEPVPADDRQLQLEHPHRLVQVPGLRRRDRPRLRRSRPRRARSASSRARAPPAR